MITYPVHRDLLDRVGHPRILVLGDLILDRYTWGNAERVSPEAPVLVLRVDTKEVRLGGAASVGMLLRGLEAEVTLAGIIGDDPEGRTLRSLLKDERIENELVFLDASRPTTTKERFVGRAANRHPHQILRVDQEVRSPIGPDIEERLSQGIIGRLDDCQGVLISDYSKGVCTPPVVQMAIAAANQRGIPVIVDPARIGEYSRYRGATLLKPNRSEAEFAAGAPIRTPEAALMTAKWLRQRHHLEAVLITLDRDGMVLVAGGHRPNVAGTLRVPSAAHGVCGPHFSLPPEERPADGAPFPPLHKGGPEGVFSSAENAHESPMTSQHFPTQPRTVYDITGAGDMALAALGLCLASQIPLPHSVTVANVAAGLEVEKFGVAPLSRAELREALPDLTLPLGEGRGEGGSSPRSQARLGNAGSEALPRADSANIAHSAPRTPSSTKLTTLPAFLPMVKSYRAAGKTIVLTNGCFDLLHVGHVTCLKEAAALGDVLIVAINSDASVRRLKGNARPIIHEHDRAAMVAALDCVDHVLIFDEPTPHSLLEAIRPDVLAKGGTTAEIVGREVVESYGGRAVRLSAAPDISTSRIIARIHQGHPPPELPPLEGASAFPVRTTVVQ